MASIPSGSEKYLVSGMPTVIIYPVEGVDLAKEEVKINAKVEKAVKEIVEKLKSNHTKFEDPDFGPNEKDEYGAASLYGNAGKPDPAGSKYPAPESLRWERPLYEDSKLGTEESKNEEDDEEEEDEEDDDDFGFGASMDDENKVWCKHGQLFINGTSSGDVIQGQLGDCWFLSALAVLGADNKLLDNCFWKRDSFKEYGFYVLRFYKDCSLFFVIIDDRLPVKSKDGRLIFAGNKDPNELWVPLIEKAYAKLHGCYKALIGGYTHYGLADMTGFCPRLVVMKEGFTGFSGKYSDTELWDLLSRYFEWKSLLGCSIQSNPKEKHKVEADAGYGLHMGHAYSFLAIGKITIEGGKEVKLVKLRNPWGRGEWEGPYGDRSPEMDKYKPLIENVFNKLNENEEERVEQNFNDGTFFMPFEDWLKYFSSLFIAIRFPPSYAGKRAAGQWSAEQGGNREMGTWITNPNFKFKIKSSSSGKEYTRVFIGLYIKDSRLTMGFDYFKDPLYATPLAFDINTKDFETSKQNAKSKLVPHGSRREDGTGEVEQPPYNFGTTQIELFLKVGVEYYIIPSLYRRNQAGSFFLNVFVDGAFELEGSSSLNDTQMPMTVGKNESMKEPLKMSKAQFFEKKESLRARVISEMSRLNLSKMQLESMFMDNKASMSRSAFKRRMMDAGFMLTDFPDDDLVVLDSENDGKVALSEFIKFVEQGIKFKESSDLPPPPEPPVDDLLFKTLDLSGVLTVKFSGARNLRDVSSWFNTKSTDAKAQSIRKKPIISYNSEDANVVRLKSNKERLYLAKNPIKKAEPTTSLPLAPISPRDRPLSPIQEIGKFDPSSPDPRSSGAFSTFKSFKGEKDFHKGPGSVATVMSLTYQDKIHQAGTAAARQLHKDPILQKAEQSRTDHLSKLRSAQKKAKPETNDSISSNTDSVLDDGIMRKKSSAKDQQKKQRSIENDKYAMRLLSYIPAKKDDSIIASIPIRQSAIGNTKDKLPVAENQSMVPATGEPDLWDMLIDCVITISQSRPKSDATERHNQFMQMKRSISSQCLQAFNPRTSSISTPITSKEVVPVKKGSAPTPRSLRAATGMASVKTSQTAKEQKLVAQEVYDKLAQYNNQTNDYKEVFRRLVSIPTTSYQELSGERINKLSDGLRKDCTAYLKTLFQKFDRNGNGLISKDEFQQTMHELNIDVSTEDCNIFFNRFSAKGTGIPEIDSKDFLEFFEKNIAGSISKASLNTSGSSGLIELLEKLKRIISSVIKNMEESQISSIEVYLEKGKGTTAESAKKEATKATSGGLPDNAIFQTISLAQVKANTEILRSLGMNGLTEVEMARISRVFNYHVSNLMTFCKLGPEFVLDDTVKYLEGKLGEDLNYRTTDSKTLESLKPILTQEMKRTVSSTDMPTRSSMSTGAPLVTAVVPKEAVDLKTSPTLKIWNKFASSPEALVPFETVDKFFSEVLKNSDIFSTDLSPRSESIAKEDFRGIKLDLLTKLIADSLIYSSWNKTPAITASVATKGSSASTGDISLLSKLSFSGMDAYIRNNQIAQIEQKLKYLMQKESDRSNPSSYFLIHVYISKKQGEVLILADDPLSGEVFKLQLKDDVSQLPVGSDVETMVLQYIEQYIEMSKIKAPLKSNIKLDPDSLFLYNPIDTPIEEKAIMDIVKRLKIVRSSTTSASMILGEDPRFIEQLKTLLDASAQSLPFFYLVNDLNLSFDVDEELLNKLDDKNKDAAASSIRSVVFGSIRGQKTLLSFITQVQSSLKVVLSTYNGSLRETFSWSEMLAHLTNSRNPFVTVQLLPKYIPYSKYLYEPVDSTKPFTGDDSDDDEVEMEDSEKPEGYDSMPKLKSWQRGPIDFDGSPAPSFNTKLQFSFVPPKLTSCKVISTEVAKLQVEGKMKYVVVLIREGSRFKANEQEKGSKETFYFLTVYDPRSSTEFQCGVKPNKDSELYRQLYYDKPMFKGAIAESDRLDVKALITRVSEAADKGEFLLGPAITPRIEIQVYNYRDDKVKELLGQCQVSISSVLSGSGISDKAWTTLIHKMERENGTGTTDINAGEVQLEMSFRRLMEIEAEMLAEKERAAKPNNTKAKTEAKSDSAADSDPSRSRTGTAEGDAAGKGKLSKAEQQRIQQLEEENSRLREEYRKAKVVLAVAASSGKDAERAAETSAATAAVAAAPATQSAELKKAAEDMDKIRREKEKADAEREKAVREAKQLSDEVKRLKDELSRVSTATAAAPAPANASAVPMEQILAEMKELKRVNASLLDKEAKAREELDSKQRRASVSKAADSHASVSPSLGADAVSSDAITDLKQLLQTLLSRQERKLKQLGGSSVSVSASGVSVTGTLDSLQRLLHSYATPEGLISSKDLSVALGELVIDISTELAVKIVQDAGANSKRMAQVHAVIELLGSELAAMLKSQKKTRISVDASVSSSAGIAVAAQAVAGASASAAAGSAHGSAKPRPSSAKAAPPSSDQRKPSSQPMRTQSARVALGKTAPAALVTAPLEDAASRGLSEQEKDWSREPLPPRWERQFITERQRFVYINHDTKKTQWNHPNDTSSHRQKSPSKRNAKQQRAASSESAIEIKDEIDSRRKEENKEKTTAASAQAPVSEALKEIRAQDKQHVSLNLGEDEEGEGEREGDGEEADK